MQTIAPWSHAFANLALPWILQSLVISLCALVLARVLRRKGPAVENVVLRFGLVALWLAPAATILFSSMHIDGVSVALPEPAQELTLDTSIIAEQPSQTVPPPMPPVSQAPEIPHAQAENAPSITSHINPLSTVYAVFVGLWILGATFLLLRLVALYATLLHVRWNAAHAPAPLCDLLDKHSASMNIRSPHIRAHDRVNGPCVTGVLRATILLPPTFATSDPRLVESVLLHELSHAKRRDCAWNLFAYVTASILWFQPLLWRIRRRIDKTSDLIADDCVIHHRREPIEYARHLADLAEACMPSRAESLASAGIAPSKSELVKRVRRILDANRLIQLRTSRKLIAAIALIAALITTATGVIGAESGGDYAIDPIEGTVYSAKGEPIAGATVQIGETIPDETASTYTWKIIASATTSPDGRFSLGKQYATQPDRFRELQITAPGHIGEELLMQSATQHPQRFFSDYYGRPMPAADSVLWPSRPINGQIADIDGKPVVGATVRVSGYSHTTKSDSIGCFVLEVPDFSSDTQHEMSCSLEITHPDYLRESTEVRYFSNDILVKLDRGVVLTGAVRDRESGKGIANMLVTARPARGTEVTATSDASGSFNVRVPAGKIELSVTRGRAKDPLSNNFVSSKQGITLFVAEGETKSDVDLDVVRGHVVRGRVVDSISKQPVPDAYFLLAVDGRDEQSREGRYAVQTDKQGDFIVTGIPAGSVTFTSMPKGNEIGVRKTPLVVPIKGDPAPVELIAIRTITDTTQPPIEQLVTGTVLNPDGTPAGLAIVEAYSDSPGRRGMELCRSAPNGTFGIAFGHSNMAGPGEFRAYDLSKQFAAVIEVADVNAPPQPFVIRLERGATFGGNVRDEKGSPLPGVSVVISRMVPSGNGFAQYAVCRGITDGEGRYRTTPFIPSSRDAAASLTCQALRGELGHKYGWPVRPEGAYTPLNTKPGAHTAGLDFTLTINGGDAYFAATPAKAK